MLALKNLSHGLVHVLKPLQQHTQRLRILHSGGCRTADGPREKTILHILDGIKALYHGGPGIPEPQFVWEHKTMYFATDPVALDRAGWKVIDEKRQQVGMKSIAESKPDAHSTFLALLSQSTSKSPAPWAWVSGTRRKRDQAI